MFISAPKLFGRRCHGHGPELHRPGPRAQPRVSRMHLSRAHLLRFAKLRDFVVLSSTAQIFLLGCKCPVIQRSFGFAPAEQRAVMGNHKAEASQRALVRTRTLPGSVAGGAERPIG